VIKLSNLLKIGVLSGSMILVSAVRAETCRIEDVSDPLVKGRASSVTFPDGRKLTVVGYQHGDRKFWSKLLQLIKQPGLSNVEFSRRLRTLMVEVNRRASDDVEPTIPAAQKNIAFLRSYLKTNPDVSFVADEARMEDSVGVQRLLPWISNQLYRQVWLRNLPSSPDFADALLAIGGPATTLRMTEPALMSKAAIVGFETDRAQIAAELAWAKFDEQQKTFDRLAKSATASEQMRDAVNTIALMPLAEAYDPAVHDGLFRAALKKGTPKKYYSLASQTLESLLAAMKATNQRDEDTVSGMVGSGQSGILFIGQLHQKSIARLLALACQNAPRTSTVSPADSVPSQYPGAAAR